MLGQSKFAVNLRNISVTDSKIFGLSIENSSMGYY